MMSNCIAIYLLVCTCILYPPGVSLDQDQARLVVKGEVSSSQVRILEVSLFHLYCTVILLVVMW